MRIENIEWLSKSAEEAEVKITDGEFVCVAFSQPCSFAIGDEISEPLHVFGIKKAMLSDESEVGIWPINGTGLGRRVVAKLVDQSNQILTVGNITLVVDEYLPGGIEVGNIIEFECARIDLW